MADKKITLVLEAKNMLMRGLASAQKDLSSFASGVASFSKASLTAFAGMATAVGAFSIKALTAFASQDKAERNLADTLRMHGEAADELLPKMINIANAMQDESGVGDELTLQRMANMRLMGVQTSQLEQASKAVAGLTRAGMGEEGAQKAVAAAMEGNFEALTRYIPALKTATTEAEKAQAVNEYISAQWQMQKDDLNTLGGAWEALKGRIGDLWEEIGRVINNDAGITAGIKKAEQAVKSFISEFGQFVSGGGIALFVETMRSSFTKAGIYAKGFFMGGIVEPATQAFQYLTGIIKSNVDVYKKLFSGDIKGAFGAFTDAITGKEVMSSTSFVTMFDELEAESQKSAANIKAISDQSINEIVNGAQKKVDVEKKAIEEINIAKQKSADEEKKIAKDTSKELAKLKEDEVDARKAIEENARDEQRKAWDKQLRENEEIAKKTVAQFIEDAKGKKGEEKGLADEDKRGKMLSADEARGTKLSKRDKEWLDAFKDIRKAGDKVGVAKKNIEAMELQKVLKKQNELDANLTKVMGEIVKLQQMN